MAHGSKIKGNMWLLIVAQRAQIVTKHNYLAMCVSEQRLGDLSVPVGQLQWPFFALWIKERGQMYMRPTKCTSICYSLSTYPSARYSSSASRLRLTVDLLRDIDNCHSNKKLLHPFTSMGCVKYKSCFKLPAVEWEGNNSVGNSTASGKRSTNVANSK